MILVPRHGIPLCETSKDIPLLVYDLLLQQTYRPLYCKDRRSYMYYEVWEMFLSLTLADKFFHEKVTAQLQYFVSPMMATKSRLELALPSGVWTMKPSRTRQAETGF